jgi:hypothetical protein
MKCVKVVTGEVYRIKEILALALVTNKIATYVNKQSWKSDGRKTIDSETVKRMLKEIKRSV